ncbi:hypothetical protein F0365_15600 [Nonlabens sp. Ci31]|uniref:hypothetical protein n=1 Tax=Nonlabens sp. Ci31 TaxID=2608253 RepID=UPI0014640663|nr:hypothetical protein [Nonlabens sp. Ci31]QJP35724.1 hypothetical protein F0365_15600 [Nonlabens sp. Ci31]
MSKTYQFASVITIGVTLFWFCYAMMQRHPQKWQFLTAGGIHFLMSIIINRQFTQKNRNYLGIIHGIFMVCFFGSGYFFL